MPGSPTLTAEALVERASAQTGYDDFGSAGWQDGLEHFLAAARSDLGEDADARAAVETLALSRLVNRLRIEAWYADHADEASIRVEGPVMIVGLPRTATTALHYLLSVDPQFRYQRLWEVTDPVPPPELAGEADDPRRRAATARRSVQHISTADGPMEDGHVLALHFHHQELGLPLPSYTRWWRDADLTSTYAYHERVLRLLHAHRPPRRWLLKAPAYCFHLEQIARQYPGARFLMTHRDPTTAFASACSVVQRAQQNAVPSVGHDPAALGTFLLEHLAEATRRAIAARDTIGENRFYDVYQPDVENHPIETVERIYRFLGLTLQEDVRSAMMRWSADNRRGSRGEHKYDLAEFGLAPQAVRTAFGPYVERFEAL